MIRVRDYFLERVSHPSVTPSETVLLGNVKLWEKGSSYSIEGRIEYEGIVYRLVELRPGSGTMAMVRSDGTLHYKWVVRTLTGSLHVPLQHVVYSPSNAQMEHKVEEKVLTAKGYQNYELLYTGITNNAMHFTYREFSPEGLARTAFFQNLTYEANAAFVGFKTFRFRIHSANNEGIAFTVVEDGLPLR